jgi:DNA primase
MLDRTLRLRDEIKNKSHSISSFVEEFFGIKVKKGRAEYCPITECGSGTGKNKSSAFYCYNDGCSHCFSCGFHGDIFELVQRCCNVSFTEAVRLLATFYQIDYETHEIKEEILAKEIIGYRPVIRKMGCEIECLKCPIIGVCPYLTIEREPVYKWRFE